jgi:hypothetical protein
VLANVTISDNQANTFGGGIYNLYINPTTMKDVKFINNKANHGGGMFTVGSNPTLINTIFSGNFASERGGGLTNSNSNPVIINSLFSGNKANQYGGGLYDSAGKFSLINVTFSGNYAAILGGGIVNTGSSAHVSNGIFWNNQDSTGSGTYTATILNDSSTVTLTHSLFQDSGGSGASWTLSTSYVDGGGNIDEDPQFINDVNPSAAPTTSGNLRLESDSPAINAGDNEFVTVNFDLEGNDRIIGGTVDMGVYEKLLSVLPLVFH